jgi:alpha-tubulin suppressor-like RCC1 family protein
VEAGGYHTCAVLDTGEVLCWGHDGSGEVTGRFSGYPHTVLVEFSSS